MVHKSKWGVEQMLLAPCEEVLYKHPYDYYWQLLHKHPYDYYWQLL